MAQMRVFLSSTAYDFALLRGHLRSYLESLGHQPILSDYSDVLYDPKQHTHKSCVQELSTCDAVVLVIGSRLGSIARPEFIEELVTAPELESESLTTLVKDRQISVTQLEALTAISSGIPIFTFVETGVLNDLRVYEANMDTPAADQIVFPSVPDREAAKYIFRFIRFLQDRASGNAVFAFERLADIESTLAKQWSALLQRLLATEKTTERQAHLLGDISEQIDDLRGAVLSAIPERSAREIARGVAQFRFLTEFLIEIGAPLSLAANDHPVRWSDLLHEVGILRAYDVRPDSQRTRPYAPTVLIEMRGGNFVEARMSASRFASLESDWSSFCSMSANSRQLVFETLSEQLTDRARGLIRPFKGDPVDLEAEGFPLRRIF